MKKFSFDPNPIYIYIYMDNKFLGDLKKRGDQDATERKRSKGGEGEGGMQDGEGSRVTFGKTTKPYDRTVTRAEGRKNNEEWRKRGDERSGDKVMRKEGEA